MIIAGRRTSFGAPHLIAGLTRGDLAREQPGLEDARPLARPDRSCPDDHRHGAAANGRDAGGGNRRRAPGQGGHGGERGGRGQRDGRRAGVRRVARLLRRGARGTERRRARPATAGLDAQALRSRAGDGAARLRPGDRPAGPRYAPRRRRRARLRASRLRRSRPGPRPAPRGARQLAQHPRGLDGARRGRRPPPR